MILYEKTDAKVYVHTGVISGQSLQTDDLKVAARSNLTFKFTVTNPVPPNGSIDIGFPLAHFEVPNAQEVLISQ